MKNVVTWQTPSGDKINIDPRQEAALKEADTWPRSSRGEFYCQVHHGLHSGEPAEDSELGLVWVETMPAQHRGQHREARNWGVYPHNGAVRTLMHETKAAELCEGDEYNHIVGSE